VGGEPPLRFILGGDEGEDPLCLIRGGDGGEGALCLRRGGDGGDGPRDFLLCGERDRREDLRLEPGLRLRDLLANKIHTCICAKYLLIFNMQGEPTDVLYGTSDG
jgi:hypothetical protein